MTDITDNKTSSAADLKLKTYMARRLQWMHEWFSKTLLDTNLRTLKIIALEMDAYWQANKEFGDAQFIPVMIRTVEQTIQGITKTKWTVERSKRDMRGRRHTKVKNPVNRLVRHDVRDRLGVFRKKEEVRPV